MQTQPKPTLEDKLTRLVRRHIPDPLLKYVPTLYYGINRIRYKIVTRPNIEKETSKAKARRIREGFFDQYCQGRGLDVGYGGDAITANCDGWDIEDGDAHTLSKLSNAQYDFVYSSHVLEHLQDPELALKHWWRVLKPGGFLILYIPDRDVYEKKTTLPSRFSMDHKHYFLMDKDEPPHTHGLIPMIKRNCDGAQIVKQALCTEGLTITDPYIHSNGEYSLEVIAKKPV